MIRVNRVTVYPLYVRLKVGEWYYDASATVCPANADCCGVTWHSSDTSVASVHPTTGVIHGVSEGTATIYATSTDGSNVSDYLSVVVDERIDVCSVTLGRCAASVEVGGNTWLCATVLPANADNLDLCWSSSDTSVATVDGNGYVTGVSAGSAIITATAHNGASDSCIVGVTQDILVESVCLNYECLSLNIGQVEGLIATVCPCDANNKQVVWSSSNPDIVTVTTSGMIMAQSCGVATIIAAATDGSGCQETCKVYVNPFVPVESIELCPTCRTIFVGETTRFEEVVCPCDATNKTVTWCSSDNKIATVGAYTGDIVAKRPGTVTINATTVDGELTAQSLLQVLEDSVTIVRDGAHNRVVFNDTGKVWYCINGDVIYNTGGGTNEFINDRSNRNIYYYDSEGSIMPINTTTIKTYSDEELMLLYAIDPYGVADYVHRRADLLLAQEGYDSAIAYKDYVFSLIYKRAPRYFRRNINGEWCDAIDTSNKYAVVSESEILFGFHPIYDLHTLKDFIDLAINLVNIIISAATVHIDPDDISSVVEISQLVLTIGEAAIMDELSTLPNNTVLSGALESVDLDWVDDIMALSDTADGLSEKLLDAPDVYVGNINYCVQDTGFNIYLEFEDGSICSLAEINAALEENQ